MIGTLDQDKNISASPFPLKPLLKISGKIIIVIDSKLVQKLGLDEENTWFYEEPKDDGIFLRLHRTKKELSTTSSCRFDE